MNIKLTAQAKIENPVLMLGSDLHSENLRSSAQFANID
jgi:hypothetical protein